MKFKEIKDLPIHEWQPLLSKTRGQLWDLRFKQANSQLKDVRVIRETRQLIARIMTLLNNNKD